MSPLSAPWCGWTMLVLLLFAVLSEWLQPGVIAQSPVSILVRAERTYKDAPTSVMAQILITLFRIGTLAMLICLYFCESGSFPFTAFMAVSGIILAYYDAACGVSVNSVDDPGAHHAVDP